MKYPNKSFSFIYVHPVVFAGARMALNITCDVQVQFYQQSGEVRTIDIVRTEAMSTEIPVTFMQMAMWDVWEQMDAAALAHAKDKFNSPVNS